MGILMESQEGNQALPTALPARDSRKASHPPNTMWALAMCVWSPRSSTRALHRPLEFPGCLEGAHWDTPRHGPLASC